MLSASSTDQSRLLEFSPKVPTMSRFITLAVTSIASLLALASTANAVDCQYCPTIDANYSAVTPSSWTCSGTTFTCDYTNGMSCTFVLQDGVSHSSVCELFCPGGSLCRPYPVILQEFVLSPYNSECFQFAGETSTCPGPTIVYWNQDGGCLAASGTE